MVLSNISYIFADNLKRKDMKEYLDLLQKFKITEYMINIFLLVPIVWLTNIIYVLKFGDYMVNDISITTIVNALFLWKTWFTFIVFFIILVFSMFIESIILPYITRTKANEPIDDIDNYTKTLLNTIFGLVGTNINEFKEIQADNRHFMSMCYKIPVALFLYSICLYHHVIIMTILIIISLYLLFSTHKALISYLK